MSSKSSDVDTLASGNTTVTSRASRRLSLHPNFTNGRKSSVAVPSSGRGQPWDRRRSSLGRFGTSVHALLNMRRDSRSLLATPREQSKPKENTYRLEPTDVVDVTRLEAAVNDTLQLQLTSETYDAATAQQLCLKLSNLIKIRAKRVVPQRYRVIVVVNVGARQSAPDVIVASRCLWNCSTDNFVCGVYQNASLYATANVYFVYFE